MGGREVDRSPRDPKKRRGEKKEEKEEEKGKEDKGERARKRKTKRDFNFLFISHSCLHGWIHLGERRSFACLGVNICPAQLNYQSLARG